jgi:hypothetical protein
MLRWPIFRTPCHALVNQQQISQKSAARLATRDSKCLRGEFAPGLIGKEGFDELAVLLCHEHGLAVTPPEGEVGRLLAEGGHLTHQGAVGVDDRHVAGPRTRDKDAAGDVSAQAVELEFVEGRGQPRIDKLVAFEAIGPNLPCV